MRSAWAVAAGLILMSSGCIVRETREIRYVRSEGPPGCGTCEVGGQAASVVADTEPPAPLDEPDSTPPGPGYVYVNGYWDWNGDDWSWAPGQWVESQPGWEYVPPAYYDYGDGCLYVHGHWQGRGHRRPGESIRDHRGELAGTDHPHPARDHRGELGDAGHAHHPVRDHRGELAGKHPYEPVRDHRGEHPTTPVDIDRHTWASSPFVGLPGRVRSHDHHAPVRARPWSPPVRTASSTYSPPVASTPSPSPAPSHGPSPARPMPPASHDYSRPAPARPAPPSPSTPPSHYAPPARPMRPPASHYTQAPERPSRPPPSHAAPASHPPPRPQHTAPARAVSSHAAASHRRRH